MAQEQKPPIKPSLTVRWSVQSRRSARISAQQSRLSDAIAGHLQTETKRLSDDGSASDESSANDYTDRSAGGPTDHSTCVSEDDSTMDEHSSGQDSHGTELDNSSCLTTDQSHDNEKLKTEESPESTDFWTPGGHGISVKDGITRNELLQNYRLKVASRPTANSMSSETAIKPDEVSSTASPLIEATETLNSCSTPTSLLGTLSPQQGWPSMQPTRDESHQSTVESAEIAGPQSPPCLPEPPRPPTQASSPICAAFLSVTSSDEDARSPVSDGGNQYRPAKIELTGPPSSNQTAFHSLDGNGVASPLLRTAGPRSLNHKRHDSEPSVARSCPTITDGDIKSVLVSDSFTTPVAITTIFASPKR